MRRGLNAAALVRPGSENGTVVVVADQGLPAVQALIRWDPATFARRELAARAELRFPPAARMAAVTLAPRIRGSGSLLDTARPLPAAAEIARLPFRYLSGSAALPQMATIPVPGQDLAVHGPRRLSAIWCVCPGQRVRLRWPRPCMLAQAERTARARRRDCCGFSWTRPHWSDYVPSRP